MNKSIELKMPDMPKWAQELEADYDGARRAGLINLTADIEAYAVKGAPVRTSNLANSGFSDVNAAGTKGTVGFSALYAAFVHEGTGLYGPLKKKIVSNRTVTVRTKSGKSYTTAGAFLIPGIGFRKSIKGMRPNPFLTDAAERVDVQQSFSDGISNYLKQRGR